MVVKKIVKDNFFSTIPVMNLLFCHIIFFSVIPEDQHTDRFG